MFPNAPAPPAREDGRPPSAAPKEEQVNGSEHDDDGDIRGQPFPKPVSEEQEVDADDDDHHRQYVKHGSDTTAHLRSLLLRATRALK